MSECYVSGKDYVIHFGGQPVEAIAPPAPYAGPERRIATRRLLVDRRDDRPSRGRRYRLVDRRKR